LKKLCTNKTQSTIPIINKIQCSSVSQVAVYGIASKIGLSVKVLALILLFL